MKFLKMVLPPVAVYLVICVIGLLLPPAGPEGSGYDTRSWTLFVIQIYAIPAFLITLIVSLFMNRRKRHAG